MQAFLFKNRGALLAIPAAALALFGKPSGASIAAGVPIAVAGELLRCWAVGYTGVTTRGDAVEAPQLVTGGPYAYVRNPLYVGNFITALGFTLAFTGACSRTRRLGLAAASLGTMAAVYAAIVPHEEQFLRSRFGEEFETYCKSVPPVLPSLRPFAPSRGVWNATAIAQAESKTFMTFAVMLAALAIKSARG